MDFTRTSARFSIRPQGPGWRWETFDDQGRLHQAGSAPTKSLAAASVIVARTRAATLRAA